VCAYAAHIAAQLGAHIVKVKLPSSHLEQEAARRVYEEQQIPIGTLAERVRHVVQATFNGRRIVIFSGGPAESDDAVLDEVTAIHAGGGFGSIIGRNSFQRSNAADTASPPAHQQSTVSHSDIARRAYELYLERRDAHGHDGDDWRRAEDELQSAAAKT